MNFSVFNCLVKPSSRILWSINERKRIKGPLKDVHFPHQTPLLLSKLCHTQKTFSYNKVEIPENMGECYQQASTLNHLKNA